MDNTEQLIEEYSYLIPATMSKMFNNVDNLAHSKGLEKSDLYSFGLIGLWEAIKTYDESKNASLRNHCIRCIRWSIGRSLARQGKHDTLYKATNFNKKDVNTKVNIISMSQKPHDNAETDFYDSVAVDNIVNFDTDVVESRILAKESYKSILGLLSDREKEMIVMKANGMSYTQIGEKYGIKKQAVGHRFIRLQDKIKRHMGVVAN
jgi:RNA polymerase sigma factor (sigma-70 family)